LFDAAADFRERLFHFHIEVMNASFLVIQKKKWRNIQRCNAKKLYPLLMPVLSPQKGLLMFYPASATTNAT
jgi:hypothetical protein